MQPDGNQIPDRVYLHVTATFRDDGVILPLAITWQDGGQCKIERTMKIRPVFPASSGCPQEDKYTVVVNGRQSSLFFERNDSLSGNNLGRWYIPASA